MRLALLHPETARDSARLALQSAAAACATWLVMQQAGLAHTSWAVISALFVGQVTLDGTLKAGLGRLAGTLLGSAIGLASVWLLGGPEWTIARLAIAALTVNAIANLHPEMRYGVVAASVIALETDPVVLQGATDRAIAILIGTVLGILAALAVWPQSARERGLRGLRQALRACRDLLDVGIREALGDRDSSMSPVHERVLLNLRQAREAAQAVKVGRARSPDVGAAVHAAERLWHALILVDRTVEGGRPLNLDQDGPLGGALQNARTEACSYLTEVIEWLSGGDPPGAPEALRGALESAKAEARRIEAESAPDNEEAMNTQALVFAMAEVGRNLEELVRSCGASPEPAGS